MSVHLCTFICAAAVVHNKQRETKKDCPPGKIINPITNRCVNENGVVAKKLAKLIKNKKTCPPGKKLNPLTNRCIKIK